jgi:hypothetical protein
MLDPIQTSLLRVLSGLGQTMPLHLLGCDCHYLWMAKQSLLRVHLRLAHFLRVLPHHRELHYKRDQDSSEITVRFHSLRSRQLSV